MTKSQINVFLGSLLVLLLWFGHETKISTAAAFLAPSDLQNRRGPASAAFFTPPLLQPQEHRHIISSTVPSPQATKRPRTIPHASFFFSLQAQDENHDNDSPQSAPTANQTNKRNNQNSNKSNNNNVIKSFDTALAIVPPDEVWDTIQRARYIAQDKSYTTWPPCLRLFHPFGTERTITTNNNLNGNDDDNDSLIFQIADCIEEFQIESFDITLTDWSIIPHAEAMELQWMQERRQQEQLQQQRQQMNNDFADGLFDNNIHDDGVNVADLSPTELRRYQERKQVQALIAEQERVGREKLRERLEKEAKNKKAKSKSTTETRKQQGESTTTTTNQGKKNNNNEDSYQEFDGPCVICLEPDTESRQDLLTLRSVLQQHAGLAPFSPFAPTATVDPSIPLGSATSRESAAASSTTAQRSFADFRPMIPIASFARVSQAIPVAQKLRKLWQPLTWEVTDLQIVSSFGGGGSEQDYNYMSSSFANPDLAFGIGGGMLENTESSSNDNMMGCSAMIMLYGEEVEMDDDLNEEIANFVAEKGEDGGFINTKVFAQSSKQSRNYKDDDDDDDAEKKNNSGGTSWSASVEDLNLSRNGAIENIEAYLAAEDDEADYDAGTVVVIGRVHFFTGDARIYQGMPATSMTSEAASSKAKSTAASGIRSAKAATKKKKGVTDDETSKE